MTRPVSSVIARQNTDVPGGYMDEGLRERQLRTLGRVPHARDFDDLVITTAHGGVVRLSDLGEAVDTTKEVRSLARLDGKRFRRVDPFVGFSRFGK